MRSNAACFSTVGIVAAAVVGVLAAETRVRVEALNKRNELHYKSILWLL